MKSPTLPERKTDRHESNSCQNTLTKPRDLEIEIQATKSRLWLGYGDEGSKHGVAQSNPKGKKCRECKGDH